MYQKLLSRSGITYIMFWLLLSYIVAALVWWFISLERQNDNMLAYKLHQTEINLQASNNFTTYESERQKANEEHGRNRVKYAGEGLVFLGLILMGAAFFFRLIRRQFMLQQQQQNFMMAVTHELKTPIAVAKLNLETLLKHQLDDQKQQKIIKMTLDETKRLDFLTNNILVSSQLESRGYTMNREDLDFSTLLKDRLMEFKGRFPDRTFLSDIEPDADLRGDPLLLQILVNNLLENAIKYTDKNQPIWVNLKKKHSGVRMEVIDAGPGVPNEEKTKIFSKFYRIGNEATRKKQGTGLGLYLCRKIADDHNADITVTDNKPSGCIFALVFNS